MHNNAPVLISYNPSTQMHRVMRNNDAKHAETKEFAGAVLQQVYRGDGAIEALLELSKQVPNQWHIVDDKPKPKPRVIWGRMVL